MHRDRDLASGVRVSRSVGEEIDEYLLQTLGIRLQPHWLFRQHDIQLLAALIAF